MLLTPKTVTATTHREAAAFSGTALLSQYVKSLKPTFQEPIQGTQRKREKPAAPYKRIK